MRHQQKYIVKRFSRYRQIRAAGLALGLGLALALAGCGDSTKVGGDLAAKKGAPGAGACRLGECTTTTAPAVTTTTARAQATTTTARPAVTTTAVKSAPTTTRPAGPFVITIQGDNASGGQLTPSEATVPKGTLVRWTNADSVPRSIEAENGSFTSPELAPGASWEYRPASPGTFEYHDGTRPYAVATLHVTP
jgi:plastocyanin